MGKIDLGLPRTVGRPAPGDHPRVVALRPVASAVDLDEICDLVIGARRGELEIPLSANPPSAYWLRELLRQGPYFEGCDDVLDAGVVLLASCFVEATDEALSRYTGVPLPRVQGFIRHWLQGKVESGWDPEWDDPETGDMGIMLTAMLGCGQVASSIRDGKRYWQHPDTMPPPQRRRHGQPVDKATKAHRWYERVVAGETTQQIARSDHQGRYQASHVKTVVRNHCEMHGLDVPVACQLIQRRS